MSYYQIYNEMIKDLLITNNNQKIEICEDPVRGTVITGLAQVSISNRQEVMDLLAVGASNRVTGSTD
jgi:hypothetical protein